MMTITTSTRHWLVRAATGAMFTALVSALVACGGASKEEAAAPAPTTEPAPAGDQADPAAASPITAEDCERQGGRVVGDIGDGKVACPPEEKTLGRVAIGIEGGVCCAPAGAGAAAGTP
jgi:hypothetical protein